MVVGWELLLNNSLAREAASRIYYITGKNSVDHILITNIPWKLPTPFVPEKLSSCFVHQIQPMYHIIKRCII